MKRLSPLDGFISIHYQHVRMLRQLGRSSVLEFDFHHWRHWFSISQKTERGHRRICSAIVYVDRAKVEGRNIRKRVGLACLAVATLLTTALDAAADLFAHFLDEKRGAAGRARLVDRAIPQGILACRILTAGKE